MQDNKDAILSHWIGEKGLAIGRFLFRWGLRLLGPLLLVYILLKNQKELGVVWQTLQDVHWVPLLAAFVLVFPFILLKGWRWQIILDDLGQHAPWHKLTLYYALGIFLGAAIPGQAGDFLKAWYLQEDGYDLGAALISTVVDRIFDMMIMGLLALTGIYLLWQLLPQKIVLALIVVMIGGILLVLSLFLSRRWRNWFIDRVLRYLTPSTVRRMLGEKGARAYLDRFFLGWRSTTLGTAISLVSFGTTFFRLWLLVLAIGKTLPLGVFVPTMALMSLGSLLSVAGLGAREVILLAILSTSAIGWSQGDILSLSALILCLGVENLIIGLPLYLARPLGSKLGRNR